MKRLIAISATTAFIALALAAAGWALATGPGREFLRVQTEEFVSDLLEGAVSIARVELVFANGLGLRGFDVNVYPNDDGYGMRADVVTIELREWGLAALDLELAMLRVEGFELRTTLDAQGVWNFPPLRALQEDLAEERGDEWREFLLMAMAEWESVTRYLLESERIADHIVIESAHVEFVDRTLEGRIREGMVTQRFALTDASARLDRPWPVGGGALALAGRLVGPDGRSAPISWTGHGDGDGVHSAIETGRLDLDVLDGYVQGVSRRADVDGTMVARILLHSPDPGHQEAQLEAELSEFVPTIVLADSAVPLELPVNEISARVTADPDVARLIGVRIRGPRVTLGIDGRIERPIGASSLTHLDFHIDGANLDDVAPLLRQLPRQTVEALMEWFDRLESGRVDHIGISGTTRLSEWAALAGGELSLLPHNFLMQLRVSDVTARLEGDDLVRRAGFEADWTAERMELRRGSGSWRGEPLPEFNLTVDGFSRFVGLRESKREIQARPTPGAARLWEILLSGDEEQNTTSTRFQVDVDYLEHPILRWPVEDAHIIVTPTPTGSEGHVLAATWGGQPVVAEILYQAVPVHRITIGLEAVESLPEPVDLRPDGEPPPPGEWGLGRFKLEPHATAPGQTPDLLASMSGNFRFEKSEIHLTEVDLGLRSDVQASATLSLDLRDSDRIGVDLTGQLVESSCDGLGQLGGLPPGAVTGTADAFLDLEGYLETREELLRGIRGTIVASAKEGQVRKRVPIAVSLAAATDGFNPFAKRETLEYETITGEFTLNGGVLTAQRLEIEGPVRIYATGSIDLLEEPNAVDAVVGVFLLQRVREFLGKLPLVKWVMPGSDHGFVGAYFRVQGTTDEPEISTMVSKTFREELPDVISAPIDVIEWLWNKGTGRDPESPDGEPDPADSAEAQSGATAE